jgi:hypothetical protein
MLAQGATVAPVEAAIVVVALQVKVFTAIMA